MYNVAGREFYSEQRAAEYEETLRAERARRVQAVEAEQAADVQAEADFETKPEHL